MKPRRLAAFWLLAALLLASGCAPSDPLEATVAADSPSRFELWQSRLTRNAPPDLRQRYEAAVQEIKLKIMADRAATGNEAIDAALRERIHGRPLREVLQLGLESKVWRLREQLTGLEFALGANAMLDTKPGDHASERYLRELHAKQAKRLDDTQQQIESAERELAPLRAKTGRSLLTPPKAPAGGKGTPKVSV